ncbi:hypothetical protein GII30_16805 [Gordonia amarae]|uniref:Ferrous iron transport protein A n=2 Tax=Gordonia amarae TaxID=36821 RepID=G7GT74_9ACTN|nr:FeoA family protein [Gordonia amarae]MCS3880075.1 Fe2+ transport system protein FeoA [Gordonia amarae]QHN18449.1 hypothetical protein GII35_17120 [Gordonia amarae]QHN22931.1 hypothetical protein GII34_16660 [Gordonia amarae]QHN31833.1 hypothetical protein GII32_16970 [Gordonia amarae]QHN40580.1 hypothetical protein GII30_16805 [Gordonia amarae]
MSESAQPDLAYGKASSTVTGARYTTLDRVQPGHTATVIGISGDADPHVIHRLSAMGLVRGTEVTVLRAAPLRDPRQYRFRDTSICLRGAQTSLIDVELRGEAGTDHE